MGGHRLRLLPLVGIALLILASSSSPASSETSEDSLHHIGINLLEFTADDREQWDEDQSPPDAFRICILTGEEEHCDNIAFEENRWTLKPQQDVIVKALKGLSEADDELRLTLACFDVNVGVNGVCDLFDGPGQFLESEWVTIERLQMQDFILSGDGNGTEDGEALNARTEWSLGLIEIDVQEPEDYEDWIWSFCCLAILFAGLIAEADDDKKKKKESEVIYVHSTANEEHMQTLNSQLERQNTMIISLNQQLQYQQSTTTAGMSNIQSGLDELRKKKLELTNQLEAAENNKTVVQNITYNIQDSVVAKDFSTKEQYDDVEDKSD